jgi:group I intron endonuclease
MKTDKTFKNMPCIYKITNTTNGKIYIGKTKCLVKRSYGYNSSFRRERHDHINDYMFNDMTKCGYENFIIEPLEFCKLNELEEKELYWIDTLGSMERTIGYNLRLDSSTGMVASIETIMKIRNNLKEQWANGVRSGHSEKLKEAWKRDSNRQKQMSLYFSKLLTKYKYIVTDNKWNTQVCNYQQLKKLGLANVLVSFHKKKINKLKFKEYFIEKVSL